MAEPTAYQYAKLGANLEYLRGINSISIMQTTSLVAYPNLMENLPEVRFSVPRVVEVLKALLILLDELKLPATLAAAEHYRPMLQEMETYLGQVQVPEATFLQDPFADRLVEITKYVVLVIRQELGGQGAAPAASEPAASPAEGQSAAEVQPATAEAAAISPQA